MEMIRLAIHDEAGWEVSDLELRRHGPSYTWDTLASLQATGLAPSQIFFITGSDAFAEIATWHRYPDIFTAAHFVVISRTGSSMASVWARLPALESRVIAPADVADASTPGIIPIVVNTPDVSSTEIRARAGRGESIAHLVPSAVAAYIDAQQLYRPFPPSGE